MAPPCNGAAIFHKHHVQFTSGIDDLKFYNGDLNSAERILPCKVSCARCGTPIADEGRNMWLAFPSLFEFGSPPRVPQSFMPTCHIFYGSRVFDMDDGLPKWAGHSGSSERMG